jgi:hypothetical protein
MSAVAEVRGILRLRGLQLFTLAALLAAAVWRAMLFKYCVSDLDTWWHLKVGDWIFQNHSVPHTGIFSSTAANRPWVAYSWGYEALLSRAYAWFGLVGIGLFGIILTIAVAYSVFWMLRRLSGRFWIGCLLGLVTCSAFLFTLMPRPVFFTMVLFMVTLTLILEAQRRGQVKTLYWLPLIFVLWANLHIQFIYGLFLVGLLFGVNLLQRLAEWSKIEPAWLSAPTLPVGQLGAIFAACVIASCLGPYSFHLYQVVYEYSQAQLPYSMIRELQPINFRFPCHYVQLLLTGAAFFAIGRQQKINPFKLALLTIASVVAYRTMRDSWFICIPAAACIADTCGERSESEPAQRWFETVGVFASVALLGLLFARNTDFNTRGLDAAISSQFPVSAVNFLRRNPARGPLYNDLDWGGFLIWYMPNQPVAIDGRNDLYGDELDRRFISTERGADSYPTDPYLNEAGTVILQKTKPLAGILMSDPRFRVAYQDQIAIVFVRQ